MNKISIWWLLIDISSCISQLTSLVKYLHTDKEIFLATKAPNIIAPIVQIKWPAEPPMKTENGFWRSFEILNDGNKTKS